MYKRTNTRLEPIEAISFAPFWFGGTINGWEKSNIYIYTPLYTGSKHVAGVN